MAGFRHLTDRQLRRRARQDAAYAARAQAGLIGRQAAAGERNVQGITEALARAQGGYGAAQRDIYGRAQQTLQALASSQRQGLGQTGATPPSGTTGGSTLQAELAQRLATGGQSGDLAQALGQATAGAAGAGYGRATAELGALAQRQAAAEEFGAKLPELARLTGLQGVQDRAAQARSDLAKLRAQSAQQTLDQLNRARSQQFQEGAANLAYTGKVMEEKGRNARAGATLTLGQQRANEAARHNRRMEQYDTTTQAGRDAANAERKRHNQWVEKHPGAGGGGGVKAPHGGIDETKSKQTGWLYNKDGTLYKQKYGKNKGKPLRWSRHGRQGGGGGGGGQSGA